MPGAAAATAGRATGGASRRTVHEKRRRPLQLKCASVSPSPDAPDRSHRTSVARDSRKSMRPTVECVPDRYCAVGSSPRRCPQAVGNSSPDSKPRPTMVSQQTIAMRQRSTIRPCTCRDHSCSAICIARVVAILLRLRSRGKAINRSASGTFRNHASWGASTPSEENKNENLSCDRGSRRDVDQQRGCPTGQS